MSQETDSQESTSPPEGEAALLDAHEARVLAVLAEKEALTPDSYPLSMNALINGCNQLSSRDPVMSIDEQTAHELVQRLIHKKLIAEVSQAGARVSKYEHRMRIKWSLQQDKLAILVVLMLRGAQTAGEIRARSGRMHEFASVADVEAGVQFLIDKFPPLAARLPRMPGFKEVRYMHLLCGGEGLPQDSSEALVSGGDTARRKDRIALLEEEVAMLRRDMDALQSQFAEFKKQFD